MPAKLVAGRYELRELLGEGGMGVVYRAIDTRTGGLVAIKTMRDISDPRTLEMFKQEWGVLARLSHPNIVDIRDVDEIEEEGIRKPCFIMPLLPGVTLAQLIKDASQRLTVERVVWIIRQVCSGLEAAHKASLFHRDLKPSNIFVMEDDTAKLIDFGLVHSADAKSVTGYKGTWQYMAPEQTEGKRPTAFSDIYSLGVVAYEALTSRKPFAKNSVEATVEAIHKYIPPVISEINPKVSQILSKVIHVAMAKQPMCRYASAREFADNLQKAYLNQPIERFDPVKIKPRIERARNALIRGDCAFASDILTEIEAEGNVDPEITLLRAQIEEAVKQKKVHFLLEAAQTRVEQDEIELALDKLREILALDPENADALAMKRRIEEQRSNQAVSKWMNLAGQHLQGHDFQEARQALKEVLNIRYDDSEALRLLSEVDVQEKEAIKARADKEQLYGSALRAYQSGEISTALSKLEKILEVSRRAPGCTVPEREAVYQNFYNQVRSERDAVDKAYEEGRRYLNDKDFQKALEICDAMLATYPNSAQFQALKLKVEQSERQELSAYIAGIGRSVDSEPDLARRVNILEEACARYPKEGQFQQSLRLAREQRDLAHSILAKARQYEEGSQFADAIGQWRILRNIHPQYPGIDFEISQLEKRREQQAAEEKKSRLIEQIDRAIENGAYARAVQFTETALAEFPQDSELIVLEKIARGGLERVQEAERLFEDAKKMRAGQHFEQTVELLQRALKLDERNVGIRNALVSLFVERAQSLLDEDWRTSESLAQAAAELDRQHPALERLRLRITETKRKDGVIQCIAGMRELQRSGDLPGALRRVEDGLSRYPDEPKLLQHQASLQNTLMQEREQKSERKTTLPEEPPKVGAATAGQGEAFTTLYERSEFNSNASFKNPVIKLPDKAFDEKSFSEAEPPKPLPEPSFLMKAQTIARTTVRRWKAENLSEPKKLGTWLSRAAIVALLCIGVVLTVRYLWRAGSATGKGGSIPASPQMTVAVTTVPADAVLTLNGSVQPERTLLLDARKPNDVTVTHLGYKILRQKGLSPQSDWRFALEPEPLHIQVLTAERSGTVSLDGKEIWNLQGGDLLNYELIPDGGHHSLTARNQTGELLNVSFEARTGMSPLVAPIDTRDLIVAGSLGNEATVFSGSLPKSITLPGQTPQQLVKSGTSMNIAGTDPEQAVLVISDSRGHQNFALPHGNAPTLCVSLNANPNLGFVTITTLAQNAQLFFDGRERKARKPGFWRLSAPAGPHEMRLIADGYADENQTIQVEKGRETSQTVTMNPASAVLAVEGGIAGTEVLIDDSAAVTFDSTGNARASVSPGQHRILLRKEGYESLTLQKTFSAGQTLKLSKQDVALKAFGTLAFAVVPATAIVEYRSVNEPEWHSGMTAGSVRVKAGAYEITAKADKYEPASRNVSISPGEVGRVEIGLKLGVVDKPAIDPSPWKKYFQHPDQVKEAEGKWLTGDTSAFVPLRSGSQFTLTFLKPDRVPLKHKSKRIEWHILLYPNAEIDYELDGQQLTRRTKAGGKTAKSSAKANAADSDSLYSVVVTLEAHRIEIKRKDGMLLDGYVDDQYDWSRAIVAIRGDQFFVVR